MADQKSKIISSKVVKRIVIILIFFRTIKYKIWLKICLKNNLEICTCSKRCDINECTLKFLVQSDIFNGECGATTLVASQL